jgi:hypothetical protein
VSEFRFWSKLGEPTPKGCREWKGLRSPTNYGLFRIKGKVYYAHRISYMLYNAVEYEDMVGLVVRHKCDNPPCCNPAHLELGTHADNARDRSQRGRTLGGAYLPQTKLTDEDVEVIRALRGTVPSVELAAYFKVHVATISRIQRGLRRTRTYSDVDPALAQKHAKLYNRKVR